MVKARAGDIILPKVKYMAFGSGGVDSDGNEIEPSEEQTNLGNELLRKEIESHSYPDSTTCRYLCRLGKTELIGEYISEIGLIDEDGDLIAVKNFIKKGKDDGMEMGFEVDDEF